MYITEQDYKVASHDSLVKLLSVAKPNAFFKNLIKVINEHGISANQVELIHVTIDKLDKVNDFEHK